MASDWRETTLGKVIELKRGYDLPQTQRRLGEHPIVSSSGVSGFHDERKVRGPGVVTGRYGTIGEVFYVPSDFWPLNTTLYVRDFKGSHPRFIAYFLRTLRFDAYSDKAAVPGINRNHLHQAEVTVPAPDEQKAIANVLASLDDRIDHNRALAAKLEAIARRLFKSWFVDFDPVRAKTAGEKPAGLAADIAALFPDRFVDSELGEIPEGWHDGRLSDLVELKYGKALKAAERREGKVPVYGSGGITGWHDESLVKHPTVIVGRKGSVGTLYWEDRPSYPIDTAFFVITKNAPLTFCYYAMLGLGLDGLNTDAAVPGLNRDNAYRQAVVIPPPDLLAAWDSFADVLREKLRLLRDESDVLTQIRDLILPRLISGKLRVSEAEETIAEAMA